MMLKKLTKRVLDRFWSKVDKRSSVECWEWKACRYKRQGHGQFCLPGGERVYAHRVAYTTTFGEIPVGAMICHKCNNPSCVNPGHLYAGDQFDNMADARRAGTLAVKEKNGQSKLTEEQVREIKNLKGVESQDSIAYHYGVNQSTIQRIMSGKTWNR
jgi:hypothetical protein